ncbi:hypothetical protein C8J56DRAFT_1163875 [Mycena floridula]|nr:hypothetical protein C8J56DRAFT_1163875 [Mycena floridula]
MGSDVNGTVDALGVTTWSIGDRVAGFVLDNFDLLLQTVLTPRPGGFAVYAIFEADPASRIPDRVSFDEAATMPVCAVTAAQALFIRLELNPLFPNTSTAVGMFTVALAKLLDCKIYATVNAKNHQKLLAMDVEAVFDYNSSTWVEDVRKSSGGITHAFDCISEEESIACISQTFVPEGGKIAIIRSTTPQTEQWIRTDVTSVFGTAWSGLGYEIFYMGSVLEASPSWRALTMRFYQWLGREGIYSSLILEVTSRMLVTRRTSKVASVVVTRGRKEAFFPNNGSAPCALVRFLHPHLTLSCQYRYRSI